MLEVPLQPQGLLRLLSGRELELRMRTMQPCPFPVCCEFYTAFGQSGSDSLRFGCFRLWHFAKFNFCFDEFLIEY